VSGGTLIGNTTSLQGNIANGRGPGGSTRATTASYVGAISGSGTLAKRGAGELLVSGTHSLTGMTTVESGVLRVNGALAGPVTVAGAGALGVRQRGSHCQCGRVAPGNSIGTLTVNWQLHTPGRQRARDRGYAQWRLGTPEDQWRGRAARWFRQRVPLPGAYAPPLRYLILDATGGVTAPSMDWRSGAPSLLRASNYQPNQVFLVSARYRSTTPPLA